MGNPELIYFGCFGRGGVARLMFKLAGIEFTDTQIPLSEDPTAWAAIKDDFPLGALPVLKIGGETFCQMKAINAYVAKKAGLNGKNATEKMLVTMIMETHGELLEKAMMQAFMIAGKEFEGSKENPRVLADNSLENRIKRAKRVGGMTSQHIGAGLEKFDQFLEKYQTNESFAVGNSMTIADISILTMYVMSHDVYFGFSLDLIGPQSTKIINSLLKNPIIKNYVDELKAAKVPYSGMGAMY